MTIKEKALEAWRDRESQKTVVREKNTDRMIAHFESKGITGDWCGRMVTIEGETFCAMSDFAYLGLEQENMHWYLFPSKYWGFKNFHIKNLADLGGYFSELEEKRQNSFWWKLRAAWQKFRETQWKIK